MLGSSYIRRRCIYLIYIYNDGIQLLLLNGGDMFSKYYASVTVRVVDVSFESFMLAKKLYFIEFDPDIQCVNELVYAVLGCAMLCYAMLCCEVLCYATACYAVPCYPMLCYTALCGRGAKNDIRHSRK